MNKIRFFLSLPQRPIFYLCALKLLSTVASYGQIKSGLEFSIVGPCSSKALFETKTERSKEYESLGDLSLEIFNEHKIPYTGTREGIVSLYNSPQGQDALEIVSETKMRAYGWCVSINGVQPDKMPHEVPLPTGPIKIEWFYAYSTYDSGSWKDYCTPSWILRSLPVCGE